MFHSYSLYPLLHLQPHAQTQINTKTQTHKPNKNKTACIIEFDFKCTNPDSIPQLSFEYIFGSEEYYEYVHSDFNDVFGFFLNGENIALLPNNGITEVSSGSISTEVAINNVNHFNNTQYFYGNDQSEFEEGGVPYPKIEADGFTTKLVATGSPLQNGEWNTIKLAIADVADRILDSYVLLAANSFTCVDRTTMPSMSPIPTQLPTTAIDNSSPQPTNQFECMLFDTKEPDDLVRNIFNDPGGQIEFNNVQASNHACYLHFYNGHKMGNHHTTGEQLIPQEGIIMSTGRPEDFCWNDSDQMTTQWKTPGDTQLTELIRAQGQGSAETYDACVIEFDFKCKSEEVTNASPEITFQYMWGSDEYYEYVHSGKKVCSLAFLVFCLCLI